MGLRAAPHRCGAGGAGGVLILMVTSCPPPLAACNVTIHNRCKDTLPNCTKVKQKVSGGRGGFGGDTGGGGDGTLW